MRHVFIVNPAAGKKDSTEKLVAHIHTLCKAAGMEYVLMRTEAKGDATELTARYVQDGAPTRFYACGGDGTLSEVVQAAAGFDHVAVTNIPKGTGNDFLKLFGPENRKRFNDISALAAGPQAAFDLMDCNGVLGLDVICAGVDARIARDVHRYDAMPLVKGMGAYIMSLAVNILFKGISRPMRVTMGEERWNEPISILCICNGRHYGGGFMPVGEAMPDDGVLDALLVPHVTRRTFLRLVGKYAKGQYARYPDLIRPYHGPGPILFEADEPITLCVDGEIMESRAFRVALSEKKVNFFYPDGLSWAKPQAVPQKSRRYIPEGR